MNTENQNLLEKKSASPRGLRGGARGKLSYSYRAAGGSV